MNTNLFYRSANLESHAASGRNLSLSFSSEQPVERWFGSEILLHGNNNVDLSRLQNVGSLIYGHDPSKIENVLGKISRAWIEDRRGHADIEMDDDVSGNEALVKIKSGSLTGVSVGYRIHEARRIEDGEAWTDPDGGQTYNGSAMIATRWEPLEVTLTPIPADPSVGIGRSLTRSLDGIKILNNSTTQRKENSMANMISKQIVRTIQNRDKEAEMMQTWLGRARSIGPDAEAWTQAAIAAGKPVEQIRTHILDLVCPVGGGSSPRQSGPIRSFTQISDEDFFRGICEPLQYGLDEPVRKREVSRGIQHEDHSNVRSFKQIEDADFFAGLSNPAGMKI